MNGTPVNLARRAVELGLLKFSPIGCPFPARTDGFPTEVIIDVRGASSNLQLRTLLLSGLLCLSSEFPSDAVIGGISRGGLVFGSQVALVGGRPFVAVLPEGSRTSGLQRAVEGNVAERNVILFDNVVTSGASLRDAARHIAEAGGFVAGAIVAAAYDSVPILPFPVHVLLGFRDLIDAALGSGIINTSRRNQILRSIR